MDDASYARENCTDYSPDRHRQQIRSNIDDESRADYSANHTNHPLNPPPKSVVKFCSQCGQRILGTDGTDGSEKFSRWTTLPTHARTARITPQTATDNKSVPTLMTKAKPIIPPATQAIRLIRSQIRCQVLQPVRTTDVGNGWHRHRHRQQIRSNIDDESRADYSANHTNHPLNPHPKSVVKFCSQCGQRMLGTDGTDTATDNKSVPTSMTKAEPTIPPTTQIIRLIRTPNPLSSFAASADNGCWERMAQMALRNFRVGRRFLRTRELHGLLPTQPPTTNPF